MTNPINRRALLHASPALLAPSILAGPAAASAETPILRMYREWRAEMDFLGDPEGRQLDEATFDARTDALCRLEDRIAAEPSTCLADIAAKVASCCGQGDFAPSEPIWRECEAILAGGAA